MRTIALALFVLATCAGCRMVQHEVTYQHEKQFHDHMEEHFDSYANTYVVAKANTWRTPALLILSLLTGGGWAGSYIHRLMKLRQLKAKLKETSQV